MADTSPVPDYAGLLRLDGKSHIVLGAGQGMGRQSSHALAQMGAKVFCVDLEQERAEQVAAEVDGIPWVADITKRDDVQKLVDEAEGAMGSIDGIVDIVGIAGWGGVLEIDDAEWDWQFDVVLRHAYLISQIGGRAMKESGGGTMVFIASVSGLTAAPNHAHYGAAKAGLMAWMQSVAIELAPFGIRANCVAPGTILTPRMEALFDEERSAANAAAVPLGHMGAPSDIAGAVLYFSTPMSRFVSGRTLVVDGGVDATFPYSPM
ncbi:SDR family NAD(P)-dependent oxidoreductase [Candidatus Poriferisocius sp.]|uniref:SDR family NAD(P)-dependent oxidoreductase n=1 Tax=Candidatus Poriferisocius sp. TaxID=3101276 RepID=UPI003B5ADE42